MNIASARFGIAALAFAAALSALAVQRTRTGTADNLTAVAVTVKG